MLADNARVSLGGALLGEGSQKAAGRFCGPAIVLPDGLDLHPMFPRRLVNPKDAHREYIRGPAHSDAAFS